MEPAVSPIEVVKSRDLTPGVSTPGIARQKAFDGENVTVSQSTIAARVISKWHHHGERTLFGYLISGQLRFDYGPGGKESVELAAGDYFRIPAGVVHRDVNTSGSVEAVVVAVLVGKGPTVIDTPGPATR